jgi:prophage regulatory protein
MTADLQILPEREVCKLLSVSRVTLWKWRKRDPEFPKALRLSKTRIGWRASDLAKWLAKRPRA